MTASILPLQLNKMKGPELESAAINKSNLLLIETDVQKYKSLKTVGTMGTLVVKIAKESILFWMRF